MINGRLYRNDRFLGLRRAENRVNWTRAFWRYAHRRYQIRKPSLLRERLAFGVAGFFGFIYAVAFWHDFEGNLEVIPGVLALVVLPLFLAIAHRRIWTCTGFAPVT